MHDLTYIEHPEHGGRRHASRTSGSSPRALERGATRRSRRRAPSRPRCALTTTCRTTRSVATPLGVDDSWFDVDAGPRPRRGCRSGTCRPDYVVFVGSLDPRKNLRRLLAAHEQAPARRPVASPTWCSPARPGGRPRRAPGPPSTSPGGSPTRTCARSSAGRPALVLPVARRGLRPAGDRGRARPACPFWPRTCRSCTRWPRPDTVYATPTDVDALADGLVRLLAAPPNAGGRRRTAGVGATLHVGRRVPTATLAAYATDTVVSPAPDVTVVTVTYEAADLVRACLDGLRAQELGDVTHGRGRRRQRVHATAPPTLVAREYPEVRVVAHPVNLGVRRRQQPRARGRATRATSILLNNDAVPGAGLRRHAGPGHGRGRPGRRGDGRHRPARRALPPRRAGRRRGGTRVVRGPDGAWVADPAGPVRLVNSTGNEVRTDGFGVDRGWLADARTAPPRSATCSGSAVRRRSCGRRSARRRPASTSASSCTTRTPTSPGACGSPGYRVEHCPEAVVLHVHAASSRRGQRVLPVPRPAQPARRADEERVDGPVRAGARALSSSRPRRSRLRRGRPGRGAATPAPGARLLRRAAPPPAARAAPDRADARASVAGEVESLLVAARPRGPYRAYRG